MTTFILILTTNLTFSQPKQVKTTLIREDASYKLACKIQMEYLTTKSITQNHKNVLKSKYNQRSNIFVRPNRKP